ncbi:MAG: hypothetical protein KDK97_20165 [Verrucomicrobiales bacterium]|nr:hypothetical protein [Verrucomicrobiales bacterium]
MKLLLVFTLAATVCPILADNANRSDEESSAIRESAAAFCTEVRRERIEGLPTPEQLQRLSSLITPELHSVIERARTLQQEQIRTQPDEKPDWIEGDLFSSLFEGVSTWGLGEVFTAPTVDATVKVDQTHAESQQDPVSWTDTLVFKRRGKRWLLNDIMMGGNSEFNADTTLRSRLPGGIKESQDHDSPDGKWRVTFVRAGDDLKRVTLTDKVGHSEPIVLFRDKMDRPCTFPTWLIWSPDGKMLALRPGDSPRFTSTLVFRLVDQKWTSVVFPEFYPAEKKTLAENGFHERDSLNDAEFWQDDKTLVIHYFGSFTNGDDGDGFDKLISIRIDDKGTASVVVSVDTPAGY